MEEIYIVVEDTPYESWAIVSVYTDETKANAKAKELQSNNKNLCSNFQVETYNIEE